MIGNFSFGIEEEFFLSSIQTRKPALGLTRRFLADAELALQGHARPEMLQSQIEIATPPLNDMDQALELLSSLRHRLHNVAGDHGLRPLAAGTHPMARWDGQRASPKRRYKALMDELQMLGNRNIVCGLHIHVSLPDPARRVDVMRRMTPYLPLFLALSTSSPFWQGRRTGLMGYRLAAYDELPRTGLPEFFSDEAEYRRYVAALIDSGAVPDETQIWWAIRPSAGYPTLELRIADSCTKAEHAVAIAALYRCLVRHLTREPAHHRDIGPVERAIAVENKWIAQRRGVGGAFIDAASRTLRPVPELVEDLLAMVHADAHALDCEAAISGIRSILTDGTSACGQIARHNDALARGLSEAEALHDVVDWLADATAGSVVATAPTIH
jgi:glutamate---cysteine ligase / carboxylate-amine ligase